MHLGDNDQQINCRQSGQYGHPKKCYPKMSIFWTNLFASKKRFNETFHNFSIDNRFKAMEREFSVLTFLLAKLSEMVSKEY